MDNDNNMDPFIPFDVSDRDIEECLEHMDGKIMICDKKKCACGRDGLSASSVQTHQKRSSVFQRHSKIIDMMRA